MRSGQVEVPLTGGDVTAGVVRVGDTVRRPQNPRSAQVHRLLLHLEAVGFPGAPRFLGIDEQGREVLSYVHGEVAGRPRPEWIADEGRLVSVARLVRAYDEAAAGLPVLPGPEWDDPVPGLPAVPPSDDPVAYGHCDLTPENTVFVGGRAAALIDFDLMRPATRLEEVCNALLWWADLHAPEDRDPAMRDVDPVRRAALFADTYGLADGQRSRLVETALALRRRSWHLMHWRARTLGGGWQRMWAEGAGDQIRRGIAYTERIGPALNTALGVA